MNGLCCATVSIQLKGQLCKRRKRCIAYFFTFNFIARKHLLIFCVTVVWSGWKLTSVQYNVERKLNDFLLLFYTNQSAKSFKGRALVIPSLIASMCTDFFYSHLLRPPLRALVSERSTLQRQNVKLQVHSLSVSSQRPDRRWMVMFCYFYFLLPVGHLLIR